MKRLLHSALDLAGTVVETAITIPRAVRERVENRELWSSGPPSIKIPAAAKQVVPVAVAAADETAALERGEDAAPAVAKPPVAEKSGNAKLAERLEAINGIGPAKRKAILAAYEDEAALAATDVETLSAIDGISQRLAGMVLTEIIG